MWTGVLHNGVARTRGEAGMWRSPCSFNRNLSDRPSMNNNQELRAELHINMLELTGYYTWIWSSSLTHSLFSTNLITTHWLDVVSKKPNSPTKSNPKKQQMKGGNGTDLNALARRARGITDVSCCKERRGNGDGTELFLISTSCLRQSWAVCMGGAESCPLRGDREAGSDWETVHRCPTPSQPLQHGSGKCSP